MPSISAEPPALPGPSSLLATVKQASQNAASRAGLTVDEAAIEGLLKEFNSSSPPPRASAKDYALALPLRWDSVGAEVNFLSLLSLISILSPAQIYLDQLPSSPTPASLARHLLLGLYLSAPPTNHATAPSSLSSGHLAALGDGEVAEILGLKIHQEKKLDHIPVATLAERGGPGSEVVDRLRSALNYTGDQLVKSRYVDLGAVVMETLSQCKGVAAGKGDAEAVGHFVHRMASALPQILHDAATLSDHGDIPVHFYKNALFILFSLTLRFGASSSEASPLPWLPSREFFPFVADGELPMLLLRRGIIRPSDSSTVISSKLRRLFDSLTSKSPEQANDRSAGAALRPEISAQDASVLRAATIAASNSVEARLGASSAAIVDVDAWLRTTAEGSKGSGSAGSDALRIHEKDISISGPW